MESVNQKLLNSDMIAELLEDKTKKAKEKTITLSKWLIDGYCSIGTLISFAEKAKEKQKAACIEAIEYVSKQQPAIVDDKTFLFITKSLTGTSPKIKWESARVIANVAHLFPTKLNTAINNLLVNTEDKGTVVRWATAFALAEILKLKTKHNKELLPALEAICNREEDNGVMNKYVEAFKKIKK